MLFFVAQGGELLLVLHFWWRVEIPAFPFARNPHTANFGVLLARP